VLWISLAVVVATAAVVTIGLLVLGVPLALALLFGGIASATDLAATADVVHENSADGSFTRTLRGIVAIDDAWGTVPHAPGRPLLSAVRVRGERCLPETSRPRGMTVNQ
jgi:hypothetical protein